MSYMPPSKSDTHLTPDEVKEVVKQRWGLEWDKMFDPCPAESKIDGLTIPWKKENGVNPPYGDGKKDMVGDTLLTRFVKKALIEFNQNNNNSVMLLPSKTDQKWFHWLIDHVRNFDIYWFDHRLKFKNNKWGATQPHFLVRIA